jgi:heparan-alpha-glucosaminide N-acetyltransferase
MNKLSPRLASIDVFRAITMFLMIFVNDLWTLKDIPRWLEHTAANDDGMGLADTVFPAFLFIVGLSIPFAIKNRVAKGYSSRHTFLYILGRSVALLLMGFFHVNLESFSGLSLVSRPVFQIAITVAFFLIWLDYDPSIRKRTRMFFQSLGIMILVAMAASYRADDGGWMKPQWWGILGLIGWSYLLCSMIYFFSRDRIKVVSGALVFFIVFNIAAHAGYLDILEGLKPYIWIVGDGSMPALTITGVLTSMMYRYYWDRQKQQFFFGWLFLMSGIMFLIGFGLRPYWGISKILATPSWVAICTGISLIVFLFLVWLVDLKGKRDWFGIIRPAGTSTLTCYLLPYIHYALYSLVGYSLPLYLRMGGVGILKSLGYALLIILLVGVLEKWRVRLKI